jgi:hypothetical protein
MIKDPETGKRVSRPNPESEWQRADAPHLAIISPELFAEATALKTSRARSAPAIRRHPKSILSGLLRCGSCSGGMSIKGKDRGGTRIICSAFKNADACDNNRTYYLHHVEDIVLSGLRQHLVDPGALKHFLKTYHEERKRLAGSVDTERSKLSRRLAETVRKLERLTEIMLDSDEPVSNFTKKIKDLETDRREIETQLAGLSVPVSVVALHPAALERYLAVVEDLAQAVRTRSPASEMASSVRELIESVTVHRTEPGKAIRLRVNGRLAALVGAPVFPEGSLSGVKLVAGEGCATRSKIKAKSLSFPACWPECGSGFDGVTSRPDVSRPPRPGKAYSWLVPPISPGVATVAISCKFGWGNRPLSSSGFRYTVSA